MNTRWHLTFGTYAGRLHGGDKHTVHRRHNHPGEPQIIDNPQRERRERESLANRPVVLSIEQQRFIEQTIPELCRRGGWNFIECAPAPNHVHVVLDADPRIHGKQIRPLLNRRLTHAMNKKWSDATNRSDGMAWWAEGGSTRAVRGTEYREAAATYVARQRATPSDS